MQQLLVVVQDRVGITLLSLDVNIGIFIVHPEPWLGIR
jgi:hypothetical protein